MTGAALTAGVARTAISPRSLIAAGAGLACVAATGCVSSFGPVHVRIQTGGVSFDDFVIQPTQEYGRFHGSKMIPMDALVVASEEELTLPSFSAGWTFQTLLISAHHPEFVYAWTAESKPTDGEMTPRALEPQRWEDYLEEYGEVSVQAVMDHLNHMRQIYIPAFDAGEARRRLQRYLPGLRELVGRASWLSGDAPYWAGEADARADLQETLQAVSELMQ